ncbi:hypothetical protein GN958_ATG16965, partial [Phytophthora infestans]
LAKTLNTLDVNRWLDRCRSFRTRTSHANEAKSYLQRRAGYTMGESPVLRQVPTFVGHFRQASLNATNYTKYMEKLVMRTQFTPDTQDGDAPTFGYRANDDGAPAIGEDVDNDPTINGMATPYMVKMLRHVAILITPYSLSFFEPFAFVPPHGDLCDIQQTGDLINTALNCWFDIFKVITGEYLKIHKTQYNSYHVFQAMQQQQRSFDALDVPFHVVKSVGDRVSSFPMEVVSLVIKHLYLMHYSRDGAEVDTRKDAALALYNAIKRDDTLRKLTKLVALATLRTLMCRHRSRGTFLFATESKPNRELQDHHKYLQKHGRLSQNTHRLCDERVRPLDHLYQARIRRNKAGQATSIGWKLLNSRLGVGWVRATGKPIPGEKQIKKRFANRSRKR